MTEPKTGHDGRMSDVFRQIETDLRTAERDLEHTRADEASKLLAGVTAILGRDRPTAGRWRR